MSRSYRLFEGSVQHKFQQSRAKVQIFGGGYGNGKTTSVCIKSLEIAKDYPGSNILLARSTFPKLNDTLRKEFLRWCPPTWIKSFSKTDNVLEMKNGSVINFRYVSQRQGDSESGTSNLLSATYDLVVVDQIEDPEIVEKDFNDLLGRLRGSTLYTGADETMPRSGPRWFLITCNPTRNWFYKKIVKPYHDWRRTGVFGRDLLVDRDTQRPIVEIYEGSTYTNKENLPPDFLTTLEAAYSGQMRDRYLMGQWAAYEGLVYNEFAAEIHKVDETLIKRHLNKVRMLGYDPTPIAGYDYGLAVPSCFLLGFADHDKNIIYVDGFYEKECPIAEQADRIVKVCDAWGVDVDDLSIRADPDIFRRKAGGAKTVGRSVSDMFSECGVSMSRGNSDILNGIQKVKMYLRPNMAHRSPFTGTAPSAYMYFSEKLDFVENEIGDYYWKRDNDDDQVDKPRDKNDHAMDALKYSVSDMVEIAKFIGRPNDPPPYMYWGEKPEQDREKHRPRNA